MIRVEQLYPFPAVDLAAALEQRANAEVLWCQEEPRNQGAFGSPQSLPSTCLADHFATSGDRPWQLQQAVPSSVHESEQEMIVAQAIEMDPRSGNRLNRFVSWKLTAPDPFLSRCRDSVCCSC